MAAANKKGRHPANGMTAFVIVLLINIFLSIR